MSLMFLPRGVAAKRAATTTDVQMHLDPASSSNADHLSPTVDPNTSKDDEWSRRQSKDQSSFPNKGSKYQRKPNKPIALCELAVLIETAMSDYALWKKNDLRRYASDKNTDGFLALSRLLTDSPLFKDTGSDIAEASVVQALKDYGSGFVELQMKVATSQRYKHSTSSLGSYNIRRVDWDSLREKEEVLDGQGLEGSQIIWERSQADWEKLTVYVENIPHKYWGLSATLYLVYMLSGLRGAEGEEEMPDDNPVQPRVQNLEFPAHYKASEGDIPACKGFAFVTFSSVAEAERFSQDWDWSGVVARTDQSLSDDDDDRDGGIEEDLMNLDISSDRNKRAGVIKEAKESGFRCLSFERWNSLKKEYLDRQNALYETIKRATQESQQAFMGRKPPRSHPDSKKPQEKGHRERIPNIRDQPPHLPPSKPTDQQPPATILSPEWDFPQGCLVFVKNLHPQTNKTALKGLFNHILELACGDGSKRQDIDYVDWSKGMSSCHLRLPHPALSQYLVNYLKNHTLVQEDGNDSVGIVPPSGPEENKRHIVAELVEGRAESIYWEKVPDKIKKTSISKMIKLDAEIKAEREEDVEVGDVVSGGKKATLQGGGGEGEREKKRRKRV
ncbi:hypothetical protein FRC16_001773 [Serendipita sp. 398]|nr:hypothetical protein FRC16_001773 [Serendipita sp. 398]